MKVNKQVRITQYRNQLLVARILAGRYHLRLGIDDRMQTASTQPRYVEPVSDISIIEVDN